MQPQTHRKKFRTPSVGPASAHAAQATSDRALPSDGGAGHERPRPHVGRRRRPRATAPSRRTAAQATSHRALPSQGGAGVQCDRAARRRAAQAGERPRRPSEGSAARAGHKRPPMTNPRSHPAFSAILSEWVYVQHAERRLQQVSRHGLRDEETKRSD